MNMLVTSIEEIKMIAVEDIKMKTFNALMEAFNTGNLSALDSICSPSIVDHTATLFPKRAHNFEAFRGRVFRYRIAMPDLRYSITNMVVEGDWIAYQWEMTGTNTGPYLGYPPSGNSVRVAGMNLERLENGKIVEHWSYPDKLALMQQLGAIAA
jgi:steroid delta-isomerase-like uncharacterized protein